MIWIILGILLIVVAIYDDWNEKGTVITITIFCVGLISLVSMHIVDISTPEIRDVQTKNYITKADIYSLDLQKDFRITGTMDGSFFLGCGNVSGSIGSNNTMSYYFYEKQTDGYKLESVNGNNIYIVNDEEKSPYIERFFTDNITTITKKYQSYTWFAMFPKFDNVNKTNNTVITKIRIHIPKTAILNKYDVNIK